MMTRGKFPCGLGGLNPPIDFYLDFFRLISNDVQLDSLREHVVLFGENLKS
jgi:hypothetical protein